MKTPNKIYIARVNMGAEDGICLSPVWSDIDKTGTEKKIIGSIEYVRKDVLLEWGEEQMSIEQGYDTPGREMAYHRGIEDFMEKINEL